MPRAIVCCLAVAALAGCAQPSAAACDANGGCPNGLVCNAQRLCVAAGPGGSTGAVTATRGSTGTVASSQGTTGSGATTGGSSASATSSTSAGGSSSGGSSSVGPPANFAGEWDTNFAHVSLTQTGTSVSGRYYEWGYTDIDPIKGGYLTGTVSGNVLSGNYADNGVDGPWDFTWTLEAGIVTGSTTITSPASSWCGVPSGRGTPLPEGCGWSDTFSGSSTFPVTLQQTADEVSGVYYTSVNGSPGSVAGLLRGVVSDIRVNGSYVNTAGGAPGRFSFWMSSGGTQFTGNFYVGGVNSPWCGARAGVALQGTCLGGGGLYDGSWFTNVGTITISQSLPNTTRAYGIWYGWGSRAEWTVKGMVSGPDAGVANDYSFSWNDLSPLGGGVGMTSLPDDPNGLTLTGAVVNGGLWCGVNVGQDPFGPQLPDGGQVGTLYPGCGLTGSWTLWQPTAGDPDPTPVVAQLVQTRGVVSAYGDGGAQSITGSVAFNPLQDGGPGSWSLVTGSWSGPDGGGTFTWYPDSQDLTFGGDFGYGDGGPPDGGWCGSLDGGMPSPCFE